MRKNRSGLPKGLCWITDRHGKRRLRFFGRGFSLYLHAPFDSAEFAAEYAAALARDQLLPVRQPIGAERTIPGSIGALVVSYFELVLPLKKSEGTRAARRGLLEKFRAEHGHRSVAGASWQLLEGIILKKAKGAPHGANNLHKALTDLFKHAVRLELRADNPMLNVARIKTDSDGHHTWTAVEIAQYRAYWPLGSVPRLVLELAFEVAARRAEIVTRGPQHERPATAKAPFGKLFVERLKGSNNTNVPISAELRAAIDACAPFRHLTYLATKRGAARSYKSLTGDFRKWCDAAGLPKRCRLHGLKKSALTALAQEGESIKRMQSISGHKSLAVLQKYIDKTDQDQLAEEVMARRSKGRAAQ